MMPSDKFDEKALLKLNQVTDREVVENAAELLTWLQDCNWPVFTGVRNRLATLGDELLQPILEILIGEDSIWKANIVGHLIPKFDISHQLLYTEQLETMLINPSYSDCQEGLVDFVKIQLSNIVKNT